MGRKNDQQVKFVRNIFKVLLSSIKLYNKVYCMVFRFYTQCILPEIVDPLYGKRLLISDIREPTYIKEKKQATNKLNNT